MNWPTSLYLNGHRKSIRNGSSLPFYDKHQFMHHIISSRDTSIIAKSLIFDHLNFSHSNIFNITENSCTYLSELLTLLSWWLDVSICIPTDIHDHNMFCYDFILLFLSFFNSILSYYFFLFRIHYWVNIDSKTNKYNKLFDRMNLLIT